VHVAVVTHSPWLGGAERCVLEAVMALVDRGTEVTVLAPGEGDGTAALRETGVDVRLAPARWWAASGEGAPPIVDRAGAARTAAVLAEVAPDVVLSSTIVHPAGALAARQLGLPHAWWVHELGDLDHGFEFALGARQARRLVGELSHVVLTSSQTVAAHLATDVPRARLREVPYWVDVPAADAPAIGFLGATAHLAVLGRVRPSKGQQDAVRAVARLVAEGRDVVLDVVGSGFAEDVEAVRDLACRLGVGPRVRLRGPRDPIAALDAADVVLVPSHLEAFGRVTVEAHKRGRPVVGAASGGTGELLVDGVTGLTHAPGDDAALAAAVARLLDDDVLRSRVARAGQDAACARFTADALATALLDALDETVTRAGARRQAAAA
jgi:glycosyltransferase involved in cell wall biosynthesis